ncbi:MAG: reverse transcriptase domain-containing protein [Aestuariivita sp.]|nr:reverse transcriptase domain-containing protein [Aestuariivita sp.]
MIDADVDGYFDTIDHRRLRDCLDRRSKDGVIRRMIDKWRTAGVLDDGVLQRPAMGTPQGGVISPLLSNIFRHHVLDKWVEETVQSYTGPCLLVCDADDFVMAGRDSRDGERVLVSACVWQNMGFGSIRARRVSLTSDRAMERSTASKTVDLTFWALPICGGSLERVAGLFGRSP